MNDEAKAVAAMDQRTAAYRDLAVECRLAFREFRRQRFTRDESLLLVGRLLDGLEARCDAST